MKKSFFALFICIIFSLCFISHVSAINVVDADFLMPDKADYVELNEPYLTAKNDNYTVVFDSNGIKILDKAWYTLSSSLRFSSAAVYGNVLIATTDNYTVYTLDLKTKTSLSISEFSSLEDVFYLTLVDNNLYVLDGVDLICYDISSIENGLATLTSSIKFRNAQFFEVNDDQVYYYRNDSGINYICSNTKRTEIDSAILDIVVYQNNVLVLHNDRFTLSIFDKSDLSLLKTLSLDGSYSDIGVYNDNVYLTDSVHNCVDAFTISDNTLSYLHSLCTSSNRPGRFNTPSSVYAHGNNVLIADKGNSRIQIFNPSDKTVKSLSLDSAPSSIVEHKDKIHVISNEKILTISNGTTLSYDIASNITFSNPNSLVVDSFGTVYAIDKDRIIYKTESANEFSTFAKTEPIDLAVSPYGSVLYAVYKDKITAYDSLGNTIFTSTVTNLSLSDNARADTDVNGNMFIVDGINLIKLSRSLSEYTLTESFALASRGETLECSDISLTPSGDIYLTGAKTHALYFIEQKKSGAAVYNPNASAPSIDIYEKTPLSTPLTFVTVNAGGSFVYDYAQSYESTRVIEENTLLYLLTTEEINGFYYVYYSGKPGYISTAAVTKIPSPVFSKYDAFALYSTKIYKYPTIDYKDTFALVEIEKGTEFKVIDIACGYNSTDKAGKTVRWAEILYDDSLYYIEYNKIGISSPTRPVDYGYAKLRANTISSKIMMYALPDEMSAIIGEYSDGTEVKLLTALDQTSTFTEVQIGDVVGYVKTADLTTNGLTTAQIVILILILLGGAASVTILIVNRKMHRRS